MIYHSSRAVQSMIYLFKVSAKHDIVYLGGVLSILVYSGLTDWSMDSVGFHGLWIPKPLQRVPHKMGLVIPHSAHAYAVRGLPHTHWSIYAVQFIHTHIIYAQNILVKDFWDFWGGLNFELDAKQWSMRSCTLLTYSCLKTECIECRMGDSIFVMWIIRHIS